MKKQHTSSFEQTQKLGEEFAKELSSGDVVCLYGDLGSGKTTFVQGLAKGLGIKGRIISPTFVVLRTYQIKSKFELKNSGIKTFYHVDLYRLSSAQEIEGIGLLEIMKEKEMVLVIEWAEKMQKMLPKKRWEIAFTYSGDDKRIISFTEMQ